MCVSCQGLGSAYYWVSQFSVFGRESRAVTGIQGKILHLGPLTLEGHGSGLVIAAPTALSLYDSNLGDCIFF